MNGTHRRFILLIALILFLGQVYAQKELNAAKIPIRMSIPPSASLTLTITNDSTAPKAGNVYQQVITPNFVGNTWLNYSSVVEEGTSNTICASISFSDLPADVIVKMEVGPDAGAGQGKVGIPTGNVTLKDYPQAIVVKIGSCFTGQGTNKGHLLTYTWSVLSDDGETSTTKQDLKDYIIGVIFTFISGE